MKLTVLVDNVAGGQFQAEHGLSYLIEIDEQKILFDTGHSDLFLRNANKLGINIVEEVETIVLSHGHWDHGNGLIHLSNKKLITHPSAFSKRYRKSDHTPVGLNLEKEDLSQKFEIITTKEPLRITENLWFLGEIPRVTNFEAKNTSYLFENGEEDFIVDDSALVANTRNGLIVISGCAHSGICNICEYAKKVSGMNKVHAVIGGFHLKDQGEQSLKTLAYFEQNNIQRILPSHCTALPAKILFSGQFDFPEIKTGMEILF